MKEELPLLDGEAPRRGDVALVFDYESVWGINIQPQSSEFAYIKEVFRFYRAVRQLGLDVDVVSQRGDLGAIG